MLGAARFFCPGTACNRPPLSLRPRAGALNDSGMFARRPADETALWTIAADPAGDDLEALAAALEARLGRPVELQVLPS